MNLFTSRQLLVALVGANALLLGAVLLTSSPKAHALGGGGASYVIHVGDAIGSVPQVLYILDNSSGKTAALSFNISTHKFDVVGARDVSKDLNEEKSGKRPVTPR